MICWVVAEIWTYSIVDQLVALTKVGFFAVQLLLLLLDIKVLREYSTGY